MLIAPKLCAWCRELFTPRTPERMFCSRTCASRAISPEARQKSVMAAAKARRARSAAKFKQTLEARFGPVSDREVEMMRLVADEASTRGYNTAYHKQFPRGGQKKRQAA